QASAETGSRDGKARPCRRRSPMRRPAGSGSARTARSSSRPACEFVHLYGLRQPTPRPPGSQADTAVLHGVTAPLLFGGFPPMEKGMSIRSDRWIRRMAEEHGMIEPFEPKQVRDGAISYGLSSFGYDIRVGHEYKVFTDVHSVVVDPKHFDPRSFVDIRGDHC